MNPVQVAASRWLAVASGSLPEQNQVSIEQDLALARAVLGDGGRVLFGAGPLSPTVQVRGVETSAASVRARVGELFAPRPGRDAHYRVPEIPVDGPATAEQFWAELDRSLQTRESSLLLYFGGHGDRGEWPAQNAVALWGGDAVVVEDLARRLDTSGRGPMVRVVATTCYSGGFGELAFAGADPRHGGAETRRCGLFAAPWDLEAAGCDPNPERAEQEGYAIHFWHALRGQDREGNPLPRHQVDYDADGTISLLDAHTRVRIASTTADVPTTTSERWLEQHAPERGRSMEVSLPHEEAVVEALGRRVHLEGPMDAIERRVAELERRGEKLHASLTAAQREEEEAYLQVASRLLARWPVLDDPWHPDWERVWQQDATAIAEFLEGSSRYSAYLVARDTAMALADDLGALNRDLAPLRRLLRARRTMTRAGRLRARGGRAWTMYQALRTCEASAP